MGALQKKPEDAGWNCTMKLHRRASFWGSELFRPSNGLPSASPASRPVSAVHSAEYGCNYLTVFAGREHSMAPSCLWRLRWTKRVAVNQIVLGEREGEREGRGLRGRGTWLALLGGGGALLQTPGFDWSCDFSSLELAECSEACGPFIESYYIFIATWFLSRRALEAGYLIKQFTETDRTSLARTEVGQVPGSVKDVSENQSGQEQKVPVLKASALLLASHTLMTVHRLLDLSRPQFPFL